MTERDMPLLQGAMATGDRDQEKVIGLFSHIGVMGTLVFGTIYDTGAVRQELPRGHADGPDARARGVRSRRPGDLGWLV